MVNLTTFLNTVARPLVVVSTLPAEDKAAVAEFLIRLNAPVYLESISGLREDPRLQQLRITCIHSLWKIAAKCGYPIDGILRLGGVPTFRPWRDLEDAQAGIAVCSISHLRFSGLSRGHAVHCRVGEFLSAFPVCPEYSSTAAQEWLEQDRRCLQILLDLIQEEPNAEPALIAHLSQNIPIGSLIYLGNSLPIREWDLAAEYENKEFEVYASRGVNGIDGQLSTFLGMALPGRYNCGIFGDLTTMYDLAAPWILDQLKELAVTFIVINNGGGRIFARMFKNKEIQNCHQHTFEHFARQWGLDYARNYVRSENGHRLVELIPEQSATERFWEKYTHRIDNVLCGIGN